MLNEDYYGSTAWRLDHHFGNEIHLVWFYYHNNISKTKEEIETIKKRFCDGLRKDISKSLKEYSKITNETLKDFLDFGGSLDWLVKENIDLIVKEYEKLKP